MWENGAAILEGWQRCERYALYGSHPKLLSYKCGMLSHYYYML